MAKDIFEVLMFRYKGFVRSLSVSFLNQVVSSATNFGLLVYLMRLLNKEDFGVFGVGFAVVMLLAGCIVSFISVPLAVSYPGMEVEHRREYALHCFLIAGFFGALVIALAFLFNIRFFSGLPYRALYISIALATAFYSLRDVLGRVAYAERNEKAVFLGTVAITGFTVLGLFLLNRIGVLLTSDTALMVYAISQCVGCVVGYYFIRMPTLRLVTGFGLLQALRNSWVFGRWNVLTNVVYNVRTQSYNFISAPLLGSVALGEINAARTFVTPASMLTPPLSQILMPRLAEVRHGKPALLLKASFFAIGLLFAVALIYSIVLMPLLPWLLDFVTDNKYLDISGLVALWCVITVLLAFRNGLSMVLEVNCEFEKMFICSLISAVVAVFLSIWLCQIMGASGALLALAISEFVLCVLLGIILFYSLRYR